MKKMFKRALSLLLCMLLLGGAAPLGALTLRASAKTIGECARGEHVEFGWYPQTEVTDADLVAALNAAPQTWVSYGYYSGTGDVYNGQMTAKDFMHYCDVTVNGTKYRGVRFSQYRPRRTGYTSSADNSCQDDNGYFTGTTYWFRFEPLEWLVLDPAAGLVLCETIIDSQPYNNYILSSGYDEYGYTAYYGDAGKTHYADNYAESSLRQWLNREFLSTAFSPAQQALIANTTLDNRAYSTSYSAYDSAATTDKIFLLSYSDALNPAYRFNSFNGTDDPARRTNGTDYAKCQGLYERTYQSNKCSHWWLRSPGGSSRRPCCVEYDGWVSDHYGVHDTIIGIRPALKFNLSSVIFQSEVHDVGAGTYDLRTAVTVSQKSVVSKAAQENEEYRRIYFDGLGLALDGANYKPNYTVPGLSQKDGMIPQGIAFWEAKDALLISAYSADKSKPSMIYALNAQTGELTAQYSLHAKSGADSFAHVGGIAVSAHNLYLSYGTGVAYISLDDFTDGDDVVTVDGVRSFETELGGANVSYASVTDHTLYFGNFFDASSTSYNTPAGGTNSAVLGVPLSGTSSQTEWNAFCAAAVRRFNLPDEISHVQGATVAGNRLFLNCSFGRHTDSILYVSDPLASGVSPNLRVSAFRAVKGLPMLEDMEYKDGYIYTLTESAAYNYKESGDGKGCSERPTDAVWRIACDDLLSANEYTTITFWEDDKEAGICKETGRLDVGFRDDWFSRPASTYNPYLGAFCSDVALLGYCPAGTIKSEMTNLGFTVYDDLINTTAGRDEVNYFIMTKPMGDDLLVLVATIGSHNDQWYSNFDPNGTERETGTSTDKNYHLGFLDAKKYVYKILNDNYF